VAKSAQPIKKALCYSLGSGSILFFLFLVRGWEVFLSDGRHNAVHLIFIRDGAMLQPVGSVDANTAIDGTSQDNWGCLWELDDSLGRLDLLTFWSLVPMVKLGTKRVSLEIPDFDSTIVGYWRKDRWGVGWPADVVNLLLKVANLVTDELAKTVFLVPHADGPIIRACNEDWAIVGMPEWVATHSVNWTHMPIVVVRVPLWERGWTLMDWTILSGNEVIVAGVIDGEIDG